MEDEYQILQARYQSLERRYAELLVEHTKTKRQLRESIKKQLHKVSIGESSERVSFCGRAS